MQQRDLARYFRLRPIPIVVLEFQKKLPVLLDPSTARIQLQLYGISSKVLRGCLPSLCSPLSSLFNLSLSSGKVPADWKESNVVPIPKPGDGALASNYRPISLLSLPSKVLREAGPQHSAGSRPGS